MEISHSHLHFNFTHIAHRDRRAVVSSSFHSSRPQGSTGAAVRHLCGCARDSPRPGITSSRCQLIRSTSVWCGWSCKIRYNTHAHTHTNTQTDRVNTNTLFSRVRVKFYNSRTNTTHSYTCRLYMCVHFSTS